ncbi:hypothetical protein HER39_10265 [Arthrobacter deserti]|uniref:SpaA-like prealbumin fold domain-containing protein n=1 Tax=Arthrobacter deserti TaxID=1742687 RepID=A0ABX1JT34_9MICC|nr:hypothetical protein [Arthrobacter deserti]
MPNLSEPAGPGPDPGQPGNGQDTDRNEQPGPAGRGDGGESADDRKPARLRLVQTFNVPRADFGRYWTLSARQGSSTVLSGNGPKAPAHGYRSVPADTATVLSARMDPGWSRAGDLARSTAWSCRDERSGGAIAVGDGNAVTFEPGQQATCTASEELRDGPLSVSKSRAVLKQEAAGRWDLSYEIRVTNTSRTADGRYGLTDTLDFGPGIGIVSASWTRAGAQPEASGDWPAPGRTPTRTLAAPGTVIGHSAGSDTVHTYRVAAVVTVPPATPGKALECGPGGESAGGLESVAVLNNRTQASACRTIPVTVQGDKVWSINGTEYRHDGRPDGFDAALRLSAPGAVSPAGGTAPARLQPRWDAEAGSYRPGTLLTVAETVTLPPGCAVVSTGGTGTHRLSSALMRLTVRTSIECVQRLTLVNRVAPAEGAYGLSGKWTLTATAEGAGQPALSGASGTSREVQAGTKYLLGDAPAFLGAGEFAAEPWHCRLDSGGGKLVQDGPAVVPGYGQHITCTVANTWRGPDLEVSKNAGKPVQVPGPAGTQWEVVYGISVRNPSLVSAGRYTLVDWLAFGQGVEIVSARWTLPVSGLSGQWTDPDSFPLATMASSRPIDVMDSHDYLVAVRVRVAPGTAARDLDCVPEDSGETGMLNMVALNGGTVVQACAEQDHLAGNGRSAAGGILLPPADGPAAGNGRLPAEPQARTGQSDVSPELVRLSPVLAASSVDRVGAATAAAMLLLGAALVLFLSRALRR